MITDLYASGYKSLDDFSLSIHSGLNVLVGPNGSGKSNILSLFEFLSHASKYSLAEAVSRSGGAGTIFRRSESQDIGSSFHIRLRGYGKTNASRRGLRYATRRQPDYFVEYEYSATVTLSEKVNSLFYSSQRLALSVFDNPASRSVPNRKTGDKRWHFDMVTQVTSAGDRALRRNKVNRSALKKVIGNTFTKIDNSYLHYVIDVATHPLINLLSNLLPPSRKAFEDIASGYVYNLNPNAIKQPEDIARTAEINSDGSGLAATLFSIQELERQGPNRFGLHYMTEQAVTLNQLREMFCLVNDNITDVRVENDALENKLVVIAKIASQPKEIEIPLAMLSDGTVKWFALVTAVLRQRAIFSLEEPENFLHPYMQKEVVQILRNSTDGSSERFSLMTTHSETLLNALDPSEVVVVSMRAGRTLAMRSKYADELREEIRRSGFGLGHFYVSGAIE